MAEQVVQTDKLEQTEHPKGQLKQTPFWRFVLKLHVKRYKFWLQVIQFGGHDRQIPVVVERTKAILIIINTWCTGTAKILITAGNTIFRTSQTLV